MRISLGCVADDYTGASDLANTLTKAGLRTVQTIGKPPEGAEIPDADAIVVALKSRSIPAADAVAQSRAAAGWLRGRGADHVMFKICSTFDSTDEGNIGPVLDALRADADEAAALVTPAFPETGRRVFQGRLFVGSLLLHESPLKDHPLNPMRDSDLVRVLARQSAYPVGLAPHEVVVAGPEAVGARLEAIARDGGGAAIADAVCERDLEILGRAVLDRRLSVGASGLGLGLARALVAAGRGSGRAAASAGAPVGGYVVCLAGSCSQATLEQIEAAEAVMPVLRLDAAAMIEGTGVEVALDWIGSRLAAGPALVASSASPEEVRAIQARIGSETAGRAIEDGFGRIAARLTQAGVRRLIVAGGETSGAVVDRLGLKVFQLGEEIAAGVPVLRAARPDGDMLLALKSGNFGGRDFFARAIGMMR